MASDRLLSLYLPGHQQAVLPAHTNMYCWDKVMINIDHDRNEDAYGIEILPLQRSTTAIIEVG